MDDLACVRAFSMTIRRIDSFESGAAHPLPYTDGHYRHRQSLYVCEETDTARDMFSVRHNLPPLNAGPNYERLFAAVRHTVNPGFSRSSLPCVSPG